jgi:hypothetical protein
MLMPMTPRRPLHLPIPARACPKPLGAAAGAGWSAAELAPPLVAQQPQIARMHIPIGMAVQAPAVGTQNRLHRRTGFPILNLLARTLASPPLHALSALRSCHMCPLHCGAWGHHGHYAGGEGLQGLLWWGEGRSLLGLPP